MYLFYFEYRKSTFLSDKKYKILIDGLMNLINEWQKYCDDCYFYQIAQKCRSCQLNRVDKNENYLCQYETSDQSKCDEPCNGLDLHPLQFVLHVQTPILLHKLARCEFKVVQNVLHQLIVLLAQKGFIIEIILAKFLHLKSINNIYIRLYKMLSRKRLQYLCYWKIQQLFGQCEDFPSICTSCTLSDDCQSCIDGEKVYVQNAQIVLNAFNAQLGIMQKDTNTQIIVQLVLIYQIIVLHVFPLTHQQRRNGSNVQVLRHVLEFLH
ncbi:unnamed protein product [Paramecium octaurelia]|uniref:Uncharacterized protein n=1 Tax=Paramecium octaurelia TaxID=43137 RepID=A0A8S1V7X9_PAROT|nr:unnamed protein product [Paramecium octaurelia]